MRTQAEIDSLLNQFIGQYAGQRPDYYGFTGECLSLAKRWLDAVRNGNLNGQMTAPASSDGWGSGYWVAPPGSILELFDKQNYDHDAQYPQGSLFVNTGTHHIGILLANNPGSNTATVFEQNADPDGSAAHTAQRLKSHIDGVLVIKAAAPAPSFTIQVTPFSGQFTVTGNKWNLDQPDFTAIEQNPIAGPDIGVKTFTAALYRSDLPQYTYYLEDANVHQGYNSVDCHAWTPLPYVPPAAPEPIKLAEKYTLVTTVMYFPTAKDAQQRTPQAQGTIDAGTYYVVGRDEQAVKLSKDNKSDIGWINTFDNKVETFKPIVVATPAVVTLPVDAPPVHDEVVDASDNSVPVAMAPIADITPNKPKPQYQWINNHAAQTMVSTNSIPITVHDLEGKYPDQQLPPNWRGEFSMYATVNGQTYYLPDKMRKAGWFFGINANMLKPVQQAKLDLNNDGRVNIADAIGIGGFIMTESKRAYTRLIAPVITDFKTEKAQIAKQRITKAIDGFSAGRKGKK